jgi:hypothetical protein
MGLVTPLQNDVLAEFCHLDGGETAYTAAAAGNQAPFTLNVDHIVSFAHLRRFGIK